MRVLVTGHKGYIGTVMVPMLIDAGHDVVGLDSDLYRYCTFGDERKVQQIPELNVAASHSGGESLDTSLIRPAEITPRLSLVLLGGAAWDVDIWKLRNRYL
jgi:nucleoside-diphosphate-sugar epimerase